MRRYLKIRKLHGVLHIHMAEEVLGREYWGEDIVKIDLEFWSIVLIRVLAIVLVLGLAILRYRACMTIFNSFWYCTVR